MKILILSMNFLATKIDQLFRQMKRNFGSARTKKKNLILGGQMVCNLLI